MAGEGAGVEGAASHAARARPHTCVVLSFTCRLSVALTNIPEGWLVMASTCRRVQLCPIREGNPWDPVVWVNPAQPPSVVAMRSPLPFPCVPDRPYKILLAQVGTLSFSHPLFGVSVLFIYLY